MLQQKKWLSDLFQFRKINVAGHNAVLRLFCFHFIGEVGEEMPNQNRMLADMPTALYGPQ